MNNCPATIQIKLERVDTIVPVNTTNTIAIPENGSSTICSLPTSRNRCNQCEILLEEISELKNQLKESQERACAQELELGDRIEAQLVLQNNLDFANHTNSVQQEEIAELKLDLEREKQYSSVQESKLNGIKREFSKVYNVITRSITFITENENQAAKEIAIQNQSVEVIQDKFKHISEQIRKDAQKLVQMERRVREELERTKEIMLRLQQNVYNQSANKKTFSSQTEVGYNIICKTERNVISTHQQTESPKKKNCSSQTEEEYGVCRNKGSTSQQSKSPQKENCLSQTQEESKSSATTSNSKQDKASTSKTGGLSSATPSNVSKVASVLPKDAIKTVMTTPTTPTSRATRRTTRVRFTPARFRGDYEDYLQVASLPPSSPQNLTERKQKKATKKNSPPKQRNHLGQFVRRSKTANIQGESPERKLETVKPTGEEGSQSHTVDRTSPNLRCTCGSVFAEKKNLDKHIRRNQLKFGLQCTFCNKRFNRTDSVSQHMKRCHLDKIAKVKRYSHEVDHSSKYFKSKHAQMKQLGYALMCRHCNKMFTLANNYVHHMRLAHPRQSCRDTTRNAPKRLSQQAN